MVDNFIWKPGFCKMNYDYVFSYIIFKLFGIMYRILLENFSLRLLFLSRKRSIQSLPNPLMLHIKVDKL